MRTLTFHIGLRHEKEIALPSFLLDSMPASGCSLGSSAPAFRSQTQRGSLKDTHPFAQSGRTVVHLHFSSFLRNCLDATLMSRCSPAAGYQVAAAAFPKTTPRAISSISFFVPHHGLCARDTEDSVEWPWVLSRLTTLEACKSQGPPVSRCRLRTAEADSTSGSA